jgi:tetratricopeptide (TPR) repeat protein
MRIAYRCGVVLLLAASLVAGEAVGPLPGLPPRPRPMQLGPDDASRSQSAGSPDASRVADELQSLRSALDRLRTAKDRGTIPADPVSGEGAHQTAHGADQPRQTSKRITGLSFQGGRFTANVRDTTLESLFAELAALSGAVIDDTEAPGRTRMATLAVKDLPLDDLLDRVCGMYALAWREDEAAKGRHIRILDRRTAGADAGGDRRRAERAFERAATWGDAAVLKDSAVAAEAAYRRARGEQDARRNVAAIELYGSLVDRFNASKDPSVRRWVQLAMRGIGDCMAALGNHLDARGVYRNYIARAADDDRDLPGVYLASAESGRRHGTSHADPIALDESVDDLHLMLERYSEVAWAAGDVAVGRLMLATMLHRAGQWAEADVQLSKYRESAGLKGATAPHRLQLMAADCAYGLGRYDEAFAIYKRLHQAWTASRSESDLSMEDYARAAFRAGMCRLKADPPRHVEALFAFLRARQDFQKSDLDAELLIGIARCYAELERQDETVAALWELLRGDALKDGRPGSTQLDELMGGLVGKLGGYAGPVRARVMFYLAQAAWNQAQRDRTNQTVLAGTALGYYQRVLDEKPPADLRHAAILGRARCAFLAAQDDLGVLSLKDLLRDPIATARDKELAARLLGEHYRTKGQLQDAIRAFRGEVSE